jgi:hypothetical protein
MLTLLINETKPLAGLFASTTGGIGSVPDISVADEGQAVSVQTFTRTAGVITDSFVAGDVLHIGIGDGVNAPVCYIELSSASPATGTMAINTVGMVALFAATSANQLTLNVGVVRTRGGNTNTIFSAPIVIHRSVIDPDTAVPTPSILGTGVASALLVAINTALGFVRLDASARYPALDGSQITNLAGGSLTVGTTAIASGTSGRILYDNAGVLGELPVGTGVATALAINVGSAGAFLTSAVTSITGTANEITVTGTTTPTLSLPSALTFTGKTVTGGTFNSGAFNGTVGATTPSTVAGTTITGTGSLTLGTNGGTGGSIVLNGSTSGSSTLSVAATGVLALPSFTVGGITVGNDVVSAARITAQNPVTATLGIDISPYNTATQVTAGHPWMRLGGGSSEWLMINAGLTSGYVDICADLGSGLIVRDGTGGHATYFTTPATGTLRVTTNGSTLGTVEAATGTFTSTTSLLLGTAGSAVGTIGFRNATSGTTTLAPATGALGTGTVTLPLSGTLATLEGSNTYTGTTNTFTLPTTTGSTTTSGIAVAANSLTTGTGIYAASSSLTSGKLLDLQVSGTAAAASQTALNVATAGANGTSGITTKGAVISNTHTGTTSTNVALELTASGATTNTALNVTAGAAVFAAGVYFGGFASADRQLKKGSSGPLVLTNGTNSQLQVLACANIYCGGDLNGGSQPTDLSSTGVTVGSTGFHAWTNTANQAYQTKDLYASRYAAGVLQIGTSSANDAGSIRLTNITALGTLAVTGASTLTGLLTANGGITLGDGQNIAFNTTTGTKIGAATTQKLSFWNATPIVQPTTAVASATVAHTGGGTNIKTDDTFDGYTLAQVVKALRNAGLLA